MNNKIIDIFSPNISSKEKQSEYFSPGKNFKEEEENQKSFKEQRYFTKLSLRKKKINEIINSKRNSEMRMINAIKITSSKISENFDKNDLLNGDIYIKLKKAFESKNDQGILQIFDDISSYLIDKKIDNLEKGELLLRFGINIANTKDVKFQMVYLLYKIGLTTENKLIYIHCFNLLLNFSFVSDIFCKEICNAENINLILEKLIHFYPLLIKDTIVNNFDESISSQKVETYLIGSQVLRLLGNIYFITKDFQSFQSNHFYEKIFYLLYTFNLDEKNGKYKSPYYNFLEILISLLTLFIQYDENFLVNFKEKILMIIGPLFEDIEKFDFEKEISSLIDVLEFVEYLCDLSSEFVKHIVEVNGLKILLRLLSYLFDAEPSLECVGELSIKSVDIILNILISIFCLDSQSLIFFDDYSSLALILEKLIDKFKIYSLNQFEIQKKLIAISKNLACFNDINDIIEKILLNKNIIMNLFNYYYKNHEFDIIFFISNVFEQQNKYVCDFIKTLGTFEILKNSICNSNDIMIKKISIKALYQLIKNEKAFDRKELFDELYNTSIIDKIKTWFYDDKINNENDSDKLVENQNENIPNMLTSLITDFEKYEKNLDVIIP